MVIMTPWTGDSNSGGDKTIEFDKVILQNVFNDNNFIKSP